MELERNTLDRLIAYLKEHGYPESSFAIEYKIGKFRADLVIIDQDLKTPIMVFEVKSRRNGQTIKSGKKQLEAYVKSLPDSSIPTYLVFPKDNEPYFDIERIYFDYEKNEVIEESIINKDILNYKRQRQARVSEKIEQIAEEKDEAIDSFKWICWIIAFVLIVIAVLNKLTIFSLDTTDIALLGGTIGFIVLPFSSKFKFLGMEFERYNKVKVD